MLILLGSVLTVSACTTGAQNKPLYHDSDISGRTAKRAEFSTCSPITDSGPILLDGRLPKYPGRDRMSGVIGSVNVRFVVGETGKTSSIEILRVISLRFSSASSRRFADAVETAVGNWIFQPATDQGMPVAVVCTQQHQFK